MAELRDVSAAELRTRGAILPDEIEEARARAIPGTIVKIVDHRMDVGFEGGHYPRAASSVRDTRIVRVIGRIVELDHNLSCTLTEYAKYLRNPAFPIKKGGAYDGYGIKS